MTSITMSPESERDFIRITDYWKAMKAQNRIIKTSDDFLEALWGAPIEGLERQAGFYWICLNFSDGSKQRALANVLTTTFSKDESQIVLIRDPYVKKWRNLLFFLDDHAEIKSWGIEIGITEEKAKKILYEPEPGIYWACFISSSELPPIWGAIKICSDGSEMVRTNGLKWRSIETMREQGYSDYILQDKMA